MVTGWVLFLHQILAVVDAMTLITDLGALKRLVFPIRHMKGLKVVTYFLFVNAEALVSIKLGTCGPVVWLFAAISPHWFVFCRRFEGRVVPCVVCAR